MIVCDAPIGGEQEIIDLLDMRFDGCGLNRASIGIEVGDDSAELTPMSPASLIRSTIAALSFGNRTPKRSVPMV